MSTDMPTATIALTEKTTSYLFLIIRYKVVKSKTIITNIAGPSTYFSGKILGIKNKAPIMRIIKTIVQILNIRYQRVSFGSGY